MYGVPCSSKTQTPLPLVDDDGRDAVAVRELHEAPDEVGRVGLRQTGARPVVLLPHRRNGTPAGTAGRLVGRTNGDAVALWWCPEGPAWPWAYAGTSKRQGDG